MTAGTFKGLLIGMVIPFILALIFCEEKNFYYMELWAASIATLGILPAILYGKCIVEVLWSKHPFRKFKYVYKNSRGMISLTIILFANLFSIYGFLIYKIIT